MTIAQRLGQVSNDLAHREARGAFIKTMFMLLKHRTAQDAYQHVDVERASPRVRDILKTAVSGATIGDWGANADYVNVQAAFQESLRDQSVFDAVLANGMVRAPLRSRGFCITTGISGAVTSERSIKVISRLTLAQQLLELQKAAAIVVISKELGDYPGSQQLFASELTKAVIAATDTNFLAALVAPQRRRHPQAQPWPTSRPTLVCCFCGHDIGHVEGVLRHVRRRHEKLVLKSRTRSARQHSPASRSLAAKSLAVSRNRKRQRAIRYGNHVRRHCDCRQCRRDPPRQKRAIDLADGRVGTGFAAGRRHGAAIPLAK